MAIEFHRDGPWELLEGWVWASLCDVASILPGQSPPSVTYNDFGAGLPFYQGKTDFGEYSPSARIWCSAPERIAEAGDVLISVRAPVGPTNIASERSAIGRGLAAIRGRSGIENRYLLFAIRRIQHVIASKATGTTFGGIPTKLLGEQIIPLAPMAEQRRIVTRIDELFAEIADGETALSRARNDLDTWRRSLLKAAVTGELTREWRENNRQGQTGKDFVARIGKERNAAVAAGTGRQFKVAPPRDGIRLPAIPATWVWTQLGSILLDIEAGLNVKAEGRPPRPGETGIVKISAVTWGSFDERESKTLPVNARISERHLIAPGDFLISRANTLELVGAPVIVKTCTTRLVLSDKVLRLRFVRGLQEWIEVCLKSPLGRAQIEEYASGNQLSMRNISQENLMRIAIPTPPRAEMAAAMRSFALNEDRGRDGSAFIEGGQKAAATLRQSILRTAFEGHLVDHAPSDETAEDLPTRVASRPARSTFGAGRRGRRAWAAAGASA